MAPGAAIGYIGVPLAAPDGATVDFGAADDRAAQRLAQPDRGPRRSASSSSASPTRASRRSQHGARARRLRARTASRCDTTELVVLDDGTARRDTIADGRASPSCRSSTSCSTPSPARRWRYLLFLIGLALLIFEFFTAGVGIAGVVGAACIVLACYGLAALPARGWAVALLVLSMLAFAIDVQVGIPRFWTGVGIVLSRSSAACCCSSRCPARRCARRGSRCSPASAASMLTFVVGMPSMVRTRFATPTIGREWMIGELGDVVEAVDPDGVVERRRRTLAGPHQPGDAGHRRRAGARGRHRRRHAGGRAARRCGPRLPRAPQQARSDRTRRLTPVGTAPDQPITCDVRTAFTDPIEQFSGPLTLTVEVVKAVWNESTRSTGGSGACRSGTAATVLPPDAPERKHERLARERRAKSVCAGCAVRAECLEHAVSSDERYGIWGGLTEEERRTPAASA